MAVVVLQSIAAAGAASGLLFLWRETRAYGQPAATIVALGLIVRLLLGAALFWISYLALPIARPLQFGNGLWVFASDAWSYFALAVDAAGGGLPAIARISREAPSVTFVQALALAVHLFGAVTSVGLLLNAYSYLGTSLLLLRLQKRERPSMPALIALTAMTCSPTMILWALQPLKDTLFLFLIVATTAALASLTTRLRDVDRLADLPRTLGPIAALAVSICAAVSIRSSVGLVLWAATCFALCLAALTQRRILPIALAIIVSLLLSPLVIFAAGPNVPAGGDVDAIREGYERTPAASDIREPGNPSSAPATRAQRLRLGVTALLIPRFVAQPLGLLEIGGGRGLWALADADTLFFDAVLIFCLVLFFRRVRRDSRADPLLWQIGLATAVITAAICYVVTNFGTLMRHRDMALAGICLAIVVIDRWTSAKGEQT